MITLRSRKLRGTQLLGIIMNQQGAVEEQITGLQDALDVLKSRNRLYKVAQETGTTAVHDHMSPEVMSPNIRKIKERIQLFTSDMETKQKTVVRSLTDKQ